MANLDMLAAALSYAQRGFKIFPVYWVTADGKCGCGNDLCNSVGKHPIPANGLKAATSDLDEIKSWWERFEYANIGTTSHLRIDVDTKDNGLANWRQLVQDKAIPKTPRVRTPSGGWHLYFLQDGLDPSNSPGNLPAGIDVRAEDKGYTILPPSNHVMGFYEWVNDPEETPVAPPPDWLVRSLRRENGRGPYKLAERFAEGGRNNALAALAGKLASVGMSYDEVMQSVRAVNAERCDPPLSEEELRRTIGKAVAGWVAKTQEESAQKQKRPNLLTHPFDHAGHADTVLEFYDGNFIYSENLGWLNWTGKYWLKDPANVTVIAAIEEVLRSRQRALAGDDVRDADKKFTAAKPHKSNAIGVELMLRHKCHRVVEEFDRDPNLLNVANGVLNLQTGILDPHDQEHLMTYCLPVEYDPEADWTDWEMFLGETLASTAMLDYVQMAVGYSLTGHTREECLFYLHGPTRSGKGTFTETLLYLLGELATEASFETFTGTADADRQNFALAPLRNKRLVFASESAKRFPLNPAKIKQVTGGNSIYCAYKHRDHFSYRPAWKLWLSSNHTVNVDVEDDAAWYRVKVISMPFSKKGSEDKLLKQKLRRPDVLRGILAWAAVGARRWFEAEAGLVDADEVLAEKERHREDLDRIGEFLDECCTLGNGKFTPVADLYEAYGNFCKDSGYGPVGKSEFGRRLARRGLESTRVTDPLGNRKRGFEGVSLG